MRNRSTRRSGFALLVTAVVILMLIPVVGLSIDVGVLYLVKTRLSMAVDAGALAGAKALSRGTGESEQVDSARTTARNYVRANFPANFLADTNLTIAEPRIDLTEENRRSVTVSASVTAPLYFLRILGRNGTPVAASATAVRRDVNVVVVLDRSGSLADSGSCEAVKENAINFVNRFSEGRDFVGLVTFATSSRDDFPIATNFRSGNVVNTIASVTCTGATNSSQGLWQGYSQLVGLNETNALNVILFFTDGQPTAFTGKFKIQPGSTCVDKTSKTAVLTVTGNPAVGNYGLLNHMAPPQPMTNDITLAAGSNGCAYANRLSRVAEDIDKLPIADIYGNNLNSGYQPLSGASPLGSIPPDNDPETESTASLTPTNIQAAAINAADNVGLRIRTGNTVPAHGRGLEGVVVFSIGLGNAGGEIQQDFLRRVSNDAGASNFDSRYPAGLFLYAPQTSDLTQAFNRIAAEILRMAR